MRIKESTNLVLKYERECPLVSKKDIAFLLVIDQKQWPERLTCLLLLPRQ